VRPEGKCPDTVRPEGKCPDTVRPERKCPATLHPVSRCRGELRAGAWCRGELRPNSHCLCVLHWERYVRCQDASRVSRAPGTSGRSLCVRTHLFFPYGVPALGSSFLRFLDSPHIIVEVLGCGRSRPLKNPRWILPTMEPQHRFPWFPLLRLFVVWLWGSPQPSRLLFLVFARLPLLSKGLLVARFLATC